MLERFDCPFEANRSRMSGTATNPHATETPRMARCPVPQQGQHSLKTRGLAQ